MQTSISGTVGCRPWNPYSGIWLIWNKYFMSINESIASDLQAALALLNFWICSVTVVCFCRQEYNWLKWILLFEILAIVDNHPNSVKLVQLSF